MLGEMDDFSHFSKKSTKVLHFLKNPHGRVFKQSKIPSNLKFLAQPEDGKASKTFKLFIFLNFVCLSVSHQCIRDFMQKRVNSLKK